MDPRKRRWSRTARRPVGVLRRSCHASRGASISDIGTQPLVSHIVAGNRTDRAGAEIGERQNFYSFLDIRMRFAHVGLVKWLPISWIETPEIAAFSLSNRARKWLPYREPCSSSITIT